MLGAGQICPWRSWWDNTNWICTCSDGSDWIIDVSEDAGIRCSRVNYINVYSEQVASGEANKKDSVTWYELLDADGVADYFAGEWLSKAIGFAANSDGSEARNISVEVDEDEYRHVKEWVIQITTDTIDGTLRPASATLSVESEDIAWTNIRGRLRVPNGAVLSTVYEWGRPDNANAPSRPAERAPGARVRGLRGRLPGLRTGYSAGPVAHAGKSPALGARSRIG
jgi:hypothetical protein